MTARSDSLADLRRAIRDTAVSIAQRGLVTGTSGNVSVRHADGFLVTASALPYDRLTESEIVEIDLDGRKRSGEGDASSEWRMHAAVYARRDDVSSVVHTHSPYATAAAIALSADAERRLSALPVLHDEGRILYGESVPISVHHPPGTQALADAVVDALGNGRLVLIARHGAVAVGRTLDEATMGAVKLEEIAQLFLLASQFREAGSRHPADG